jgi:hypothetical protein
MKISLEFTEFPIEILISLSGMIFKFMISLAVPPPASRQHISGAEWVGTSGKVETLRGKKIRG